MSDFDMARVILSNGFSTSGNDPLSITGVIFTNALYRDRFGLLNKYSYIDWTDKNDPMPKPTFKTMEEILDERMQNIIKKYDGGHYAVAWSGGVDSTAVVCGLLKNGVNPKDITLSFKYSSIVENPEFMEFCRQKGCHISAEPEDFVLAASRANPDVWLNGNCADQLYGSVIHTTMPKAYSAHPFWGLKAHFSKVRRSHILKYDNPKPQAYTDNTIGTLVDVWSQYCSKFGYKLQTFSQLAMLYNIACKWDFVKYEFDFISLDVPNLKGKSLAVFGTEDFTDWAFTNFERNTLTNQLEHPEAYKAELKQYIVDICPDYEKYSKRGKVYSIPHPMLDLIANTYVMLDNGTVDVYKHFPLESFSDFNGEKEYMVYCLRDTIMKRYFKRYE